MQEIVYNEGQIRLFEDDCLKILPLFGDESIDLLVTSPPYCMKKEYENISDDIDSLKSLNMKDIREF